MYAMLVPLLSAALLVLRLLYKISRLFSLHCSAETSIPLMRHSPNHFGYVYNIDKSAVKVPIYLLNISFHRIDDFER
jgi:hypothetical protein